MESIVIVIIILLLAAAGGVTAYLLLKKKKDDGDHPQDVDATYLSSQFSKDGLFVTNISTSLACPNYLNSVAVSQQCINPTDCKDPVDVSDFNTLNGLFSGIDGPTCFNLALSWISTGVAQITYGPRTFDDDFNIGVFLDFNKLKKYIACSYLVDSGSNGRWNLGSDKVNSNIANLKAAKNINASQLSDDNQLRDLIDKCPATRDDNCGLLMAGCSSVPDNIQPAVLATSKKTRSGYAFTEKFSDVVDKRTSNEISAGWYAFEPTFNRLNWDEYTAYVREYHKTLATQADPTTPPGLGPISQQCKTRSNWYADLGAGVSPDKTACGDYWSYFFAVPTKVSNGFRETEIDIFVPQKPTWGGTISADNTYTPACAPADEFINDWREAILGVYVIPNHCGAETRWFNAQAPANTKSCCNVDNCVRMASKVASKINASLASNNIKRTIHAWVWESAERMDSVWDLSKDLKLKLIS